MATDNVDLPDLSHETAAGTAAALLNNDAASETMPKRSAADLEAVFDVPVTVSAVLGASQAGQGHHRGAGPQGRRSHRHLRQ
jgi:hypothetical protein